MDSVIELIVWIIQALGDANKSKKSPPRSNPPPIAQGAAQRAARQGEPRSRPPVMTSASQDPVYDDGGWRRVAFVFALTVLLTIAAVWLVYIRSLMP